MEQEQLNQSEKTISFEHDQSKSLAYLTPTTFRKSSVKL